MRTLVVFVTLVCLYFGSWPWLRERAERDVVAVVEPDVVDVVEQSDSVTYPTDKGSVTSSSIPLVVSVSTTGYFAVKSYQAPPGGQVLHDFEPRTTRNYYLWLFGWTVKLPYSRTIGPPAEDSSNK